MRAVLVLLLLALPGLTAQTPNRVIALDGVSEYAYSVIIGGFNPNEISVEAWIRPDAPGTPQRETRVVSKGSEGTQGLPDGRFSLTYIEDMAGGPMAGIATFRVYLGSFIPNDQAVVSSPMPVPTGQWTHLAGTFSNVSGQVTLYVDGSPVASSTTSMGGSPLLGATMTSTPQPLSIGAIPPTPSQPTTTAFRGQIDEVRVWSVERSVGQIASYFVMELSSGTGMVDAWHFNGNALGTFNLPPASVTPVGGSPRYPLSFVPGFGGGAIPWQQECQLNQPEASLSGPGPLGDTSGPTLVDALSGTIIADSTLIGSPWDLVLTAPELPVAQASGGFGLPGGDIVNANITAPSLTFLTNFLASFNGTVAFPFNLPSGLPPITAQLVVGDQASPSGVRLSAPLVLAPGF